MFENGTWVGMKRKEADFKEEEIPFNLFVKRQQQIDNYIFVIGIVCV